MLDPIYYMSSKYHKSENPKSHKKTLLNIFSYETSYGNIIKLNKAK